jgi:hypothetical protein
MGMAGYMGAVADYQIKMSNLPETAHTAHVLVPRRR